MLVYENRAVVIIYNYLKSNNLANKNGFFILPANICYIVPMTFILAGVDFKFIDIKITHYCLDEDIISEILQNKSLPVLGVLFSRTYGINTDFTPIFSDWKTINNQLHIIDDKCLCFPELATNGSEFVDLELYSTGYAKSVDLCFGAFAFVNPQRNYKLFQNTKYCAKDNLMMEYEIKKSFAEQKTMDNFNYNWLDIRSFNVETDVYKQQIVVELENAKKQKQQLNEIYQQSISRQFQMDSYLNNWRFNIMIENQAFLLKCIFENNLFASAHYKNISNILKNRVLSKYSDFGVTNKLANRIINLFNYKYINEQQAIQISKLINKYAK